MTVAELKSALEGILDTAEVLLDIPGFEEYVEFTGTAKHSDGSLVMVCEEPDWEGGEDEDEEDEGEG